MVQSCEHSKNLPALLQADYLRALCNWATTCKLLRGLYSMELVITIQTSSVIFDIFALLLYEREAYGIVMYTLTRPKL